MATEYIEKQAVLDRIEEWNIVSFYELNEHSKEAYQEIKLAISSLPPADVRPVVHGRWIDYDDDYGAYCCSVCEQDAPEDTRWLYCPNCGADMRGDG